MFEDVWYFVWCFDEYDLVNGGDFDVVFMVFMLWCSGKIVVIIECVCEFVYLLFSDDVSDSV